MHENVPRRKNNISNHSYNDLEDAVEIKSERNSTLNL